MVNEKIWQYKVFKRKTQRNKTLKNEFRISDHSVKYKREGKR